jgi:hypothetical protein
MALNANRKKKRKKAAEMKLSAKLGSGLSMALEKRVVDGGSTIRVKRVSTIKLREGKNASVACK